MYSLFSFPPLSMALIKNTHGVVVAVTDERKAYLLNPNPVAIGANGKPKTDANGNTFPIKKAAHEIGWSDVSKAEEAEYYEKLEEEQAAAEEVTNAKEAAGMVATAAVLAQQRAEKSAEKAVKRNAKAKPSKSEVRRKNAQEGKDGDAADMEIKVREAEGDAEKYDALSDNEKEMYLELFESAPEGAK